MGHKSFLNESSFDIRETEGLSRVREVNLRVGSRDRRSQRSSGTNYRSNYVNPVRYFSELNNHSDLNSDPELRKFSIIPYIPELKNHPYLSLGSRSTSIFKLHESSVVLTCSQKLALPEIWSKIKSVEKLLDFSSTTQPKRI